MIFFLFHRIRIAINFQKSDQYSWSKNNIRDVAPGQYNYKGWYICLGLFHFCFSITKYQSIYYAYSECFIEKRQFHFGQYHYGFQNALSEVLCVMDDLTKEAEEDTFTEAQLHAIHLFKKRLQQKMMVF